MTPLSTLAANQRRHLVRALTAIAAAKAGPRSEDLASAPVLDLWRPMVTLDTVPVLWGRVSGHPRLAPGPIVTSRLVAIDHAAGWARTVSRWYRLAAPFATLEDALAQELGLSGTGMSIVGFALDGYLPVNYPAELDRLLAVHIERICALDAEERRRS